MWREPKRGQALGNSSWGEKGRRNVGPKERGKEMGYFPFRASVIGVENGDTRPVVVT